MKTDDPEQGAPRRARWGRIALLLLCLILVGSVLAWQIASRLETESLGGGAGNAATPSSPAAASSSPLTPLVPLPAMYDEIVKDQVAQGLALTVAQVTGQLQSEPTPDLRRIGKQQGLAQDQLYRLVLGALQTADDRMVTSGVWKDQQAHEEMQYWSQQTQVSLINGVARWFLER